MSESAPAGIYPDPEDAKLVRFWDGDEWGRLRLPAEAPSRPYTQSWWWLALWVVITVAVGLYAVLGVWVLFAVSCQVTPDRGPLFVARVATWLIVACAMTLWGIAVRRSTQRRPVVLSAVLAVGPLVWAGLYAFTEGYFGGITCF